MRDMILGESAFKPPVNNYIQFKSFSWLYSQLFQTVIAESDALKEKAFRIRYEVLCEEFGYQEAKARADKLEHDTYDERALQSLLIHKRSGEAIGTVRLVLPDLENLQESFPLQEMFCGGQLRHDAVLANICEISRLCVLKKFRSRQGDEGSPLGCIHDQDKETFVDRATKRIARRVIPFAPIGLIKNCFELAIENGYTQCCALIETQLIETFEQLGIVCQRIGPVIDTNHQRQPIIIDLFSSMHNMRLKQKAVWDMLTNDGFLHDQILDLKSKSLCTEQ